MKDGAAKIWGQLVVGLLSNFKNRVLGGGGVSCNTTSQASRLEDILVIGQGKGRIYSL